MRSKKFKLLLVVLAIVGTFLALKFDLTDLWEPAVSPEELYRRFRLAKQEKDLDEFEKVSIKILRRKLLAGLSIKEVHELLGPSDRNRYYNVEADAKGSSPKRGTLWQYSVRDSSRMPSESCYLDICTYKDRVQKAYFSRKWGVEEPYKALEFEYEAPSN